MLSDSEESSLLFDLYFWLSCVQFVPKPVALTNLIGLHVRWYFLAGVSTFGLIFFYDLIIITLVIDESWSNYIMFE